MSLLGARALIVEDDRSWQQILSEILTDAGLAVDVAHNLETATASLRATPHRLAVLDLSLDEHSHHNRDGLRVLDAVRLLDPGCVTLLLTGFATVELAVSVLTEYGALTCLRKEAFDRAQFRELIQRALATASLASTPSAPGDVSPDGASTASGQAAGELPPNLTLVVEDDAGWRSVLSELLTDAGYQVRLCGSYGEALGCLRREKYGLAVVDLSLSNPLPGARSRASIAPEQNWDGYRLLFSIRAAGIPALVVSGLATPTDIERAYAEHGIFAYLEKQTFDRRIFIRTVDEARAARRPRGELDALTDREREVLELLARGLTNKEIADALVITTNTVKRHLKAIFQKLEIHTRTAAAAKAISVGLAGGRSP